MRRRNIRARRRNWNNGNNGNNGNFGNPRTFRITLRPGDRLIITVREDD